MYQRETRQGIEQKNSRKGLSSMLSLHTQSHLYSEGACCEFMVAQQYPKKHLTLALELSESGLELLNSLLRLTQFEVQPIELRVQLSHIVGAQHILRDLSREFW